MNVSELEGALLDYWVARAEGHTVVAHVVEIQDKLGNWKAYHPSTYWAQGGPIIERARMTFATMGTGLRGPDGREPVVAISYDGRKAMEGPTHLIAAMRAVVSDEYGDTVPDDLEK